VLMFATKVKDEQKKKQRRGKAILS
jgi:hypothetical protein